MGMRSGNVLFALILSISFLSNVLFAEPYNEASVRYILLDISLGAPVSFYRGFSDANSVEAMKRWDNGIRVQNASSFERKDLGGDLGWTIVYKNTTQRVSGMEAWLSNETYNEATVRYILLDISLGAPVSFYRSFTDDPNSVEAVRRWDNGVRVQNASSFERKDLGGDLGWTIVYKNTTERVSGMEAWLSNMVYNESTVRYILLDISLGAPVSFYRSFTDDPNSVEAVKRWDNGIRVQNASSFERKDLGGNRGWTIVYKNTTQRVSGMVAWTKSPIAAQFPEQGLVSYFGFDQDATDYYGDNDLTNNNANMVLGKIGSCYEFNKTNYLGTTNNVSFSRGEEEYSISVWFYPDTVTGTSSYIIMDRYNANSYFSYSLEILPDKELRFASWSSTPFEMRGIYVSCGEWHHVVVTVGTSEAHLYLDGVLRVTKTVTKSPTGGAGLIIGGYFGAYGYETANFFEGKIDEIGIWNRVLTTEEVNNLYNHGEGIAYVPNSTPTGVGESEKPVVPGKIILYQNYPNPFNPTTTIRYTLSNTAHVFLTIYNAIGEPIKKLVDQIQPAGEYTVQWNGKDDQGLAVPSGIYFYQIRAGKFTDIRKMVFLK